MTANPPPQCNVCHGLGCPIIDPVLFPSTASPTAPPSVSLTSASSCGHVVCRGCYCHIACVAQLKNLSESAPQSVSSTATSLTVPVQPGTTGVGVDVESRLPVVVVECPVAGCGATSKRVRDVSTLVPDSSARDYLMKEAQGEGESVCTLGYCMDENSVAKKATLTCSRCKGLLFCESCFNIHHQAPGIKSHKGDPITTTSPLVDVYHQCPKHPTKDLDMFCLEENEPICYLCHVSSLHSTHKCVPLDEACSMIRESILGSISKLEETVALENEAIRTCDDSVLKTEQLLQSIASNVATELASICQTMRQKVSEVSADCNSLSSLIRSHVKEHKECLEVCMSTHQRTITRAHEIVKYSDVVSLIAADKKLKETVWECTQLVASGAMKPCLSATHITHHINIPALKEVLDNNFVSVQYRTSHQQAPHNEESCSELRVQLARKQEQIAVLNTELERKQRQIEVLTSQLQYSSLRMGGTTATNQFLSAEVARLRAEALNRIKLPAKVVSSCKHFMDYRPQNTLIEDSTVFAVPPIATCAEEISIVYDLHAEQTVSKFLLKNRGTDAQVVKTFSLWGAHKKTGPWTVVLDHAHANLNPDIGEFKIAGNVPKFRFWKLQFLENNGSTSSQQCLFVLEYVAFIG